MVGESEVESDLFTELLGEEMIFEMLIDLTNMRHPGYVEVEGGFGESLSTLKELQQSRILSRLTLRNCPMMKQRRKWSSPSGKKRNR